MFAKRHNLLDFINSAEYARFYEAVHRGISRMPRNGNQVPSAFELLPEEQ